MDSLENIILKNRDNGPDDDRSTLYHLQSADHHVSMALCHAKQKEALHWLLQHVRVAIKAFKGENH